MRFCKSYHVVLVGPEQHNAAGNGVPVPEIRSENLVGSYFNIREIRSPKPLHL